MNSHDHTTPPTDADDATRAPRPLGFWLKALDRIITREFAAAFDDLDVTRREWRLLNLIAGDVRDERLTAKLDARPHLLAPLIERGWVAGAPGERRLTDDGRAALDALGERVAGIRSRVAGSVPADDYATTVATLEAIAREFGWSEEAAVERGPRGHHRGHHGGHRVARPGWGHRRAAGVGRRGDEVHVHVHVHGDREPRAERHGQHGRGHGRGRCAHAAA